MSLDYKDSCILSKNINNLFNILSKLVYTNIKKNYVKSQNKFNLFGLLVS